MNDFNEAMFKTKVDNIFVKLYTAEMKQDLSDVMHFINDDVRDMFQNRIDENKRLNRRQMYDEINVKSTNIIDRCITDDKEIVEAQIISRYMDYVIDMNTGATIEGDDTRRIEKRNILVFEKKIDSKDIGIVRRCPGCGASMSVNTSGKCEYCGTIFNQGDYDYILVKLSVS
mgnify:CR=1 FL=1